MGRPRGNRRRIDMNDDATRTDHIWLYDNTQTQEVWFNENFDTVCSCGRLLEAPTDPTVATRESITSEVFTGTYHVWRLSSRVNKCAKEMYYWCCRLFEKLNIYNEVLRVHHIGRNCDEVGNIFMVKLRHAAHVDVIRHVLCADECMIEDTIQPYGAFRYSMFCKQHV